MPPKQACTACHNAKRKCVYTDPNQTKCDRCLRQGRKCIAHISRQGQRSKQSGDVRPDGTFANQASFDGVSFMDTQVNSFLNGDSMNCQMATAAPPSLGCFPQAKFSSDGNSAMTGGLLHQHAYNINAAMASLNPIMTSGNYLHGNHVNNSMGVYDPNMSCDNLINDSFHSSINSATAYTTDDLTLTLKQWIQGAISFIEDSTNINEGKAAASSTSYLLAALQIAMSLSKKLSGDDTNDSFSSDSVRIRLKGANNTYASNGTEEWLDTSFPNTETNIGEGVMNLAKEANNEYLQPGAQAAAADYSRMVSGDQANSKKEHLNNDSVSSRAVDYLSIDYVEIISKESSYKGIIDLTENNYNRQLFSLGLVLYEVLSGGEAPPSTLQDLASMDGAFTSLSRLSLCEGSIEDTGNNKRWQGPDQEMGLCQLSCEYLNFMGIPRPVCDVLLNLLEVVYGDLGGNDCYTNMSDVVSDLQRMLDMPEFLQGIDIERLSVTGLPVDEFAISRKEELAAILSSYNRCIEGSSCEIAIIKGESGTGKSWMARVVGEYVVSQGGIVLNSKFDRMKQASPFGKSSTNAN
eukprot:scaffold74360_cov68-Cyclotella_meneghiniana.AAC.3